MKICFWGNISGSLKDKTQGGGELQQALLAKALARGGHEVVVIDYEIEQDYITEDGIKVLKIEGWNNGVRIIRSLTHRLPQLYKALKAQKADVYYCRIRDFRHILAFWAARKVKGKFVLGLASDLDAMNFIKRFKYQHLLSFKGLWSFSSGILIEIVYPFLLRKSDLIIVQHQGQKNILEKKGIKSYIFTNLIEIPKSSLLSNSFQNDFVYIGWLAKRKGFPEFFEIVKKCPTKNFKVIGSPSDKQGHEFYKKLKEFTNVTLLGKLDHDNVLENIMNSYALINTSPMEGFPNIFIEAWACGIPVLSLYVDPGDVIKKENLGIVAYGNQEKLVEAIANNENTMEFAKKAKDYVVRNHILNEDKIKEISFLFTEVCNKKPMNRTVAKYYDKLFFKQWIIGIYRGSIENIIKNKNFNNEINWLITKSLDKFYADPFLVSVNDDNIKILFEEFEFKADYGKIALMTLNKNLKKINSKILLDTKSHLSYPFVFRENNKYFIFVEAAKSGKLSCYEYDAIQEELKFLKDILNVPLLDSTILKHNNKYWLFGTLGENTSVYKLYVFFADKILGPYLPHPMNPVKTGLNGIRSAGAFIEVSGDIYRPTQNCEKKYGDSITLNKIKVLSTSEIVEEPYTTFSMDKRKRNNRMHSIHTINVMNDIIVVDGQRWIFSPFRQLLNHAIEINKKYLLRKKPLSAKKLAPMKILFFINGIYLGGKERRLVELMKEIKLKEQFEFELVVMNPEINYQEIFDLNIKIHYLIRKTKKDLSVFRSFFKIARNYKPDIIHCWDSMTAIYAIPASRFLHIKLVNGMVVDSPSKRNILNKNWFRAKLAFPFSHIIIGNSKAGLEAYGTPLKRSFLVYNGYNFNRNKNLIEDKIIRKGLNIYTKYIIGMVATFSEYKDYKTYYKAAEIVLRKRNDVTFLSIGNNTDSLGSYELINNQFSDYFRLLGKKSNIESIVNAIDIGVLATFTEGISNSILEYMSLAKPVIATTGGGTDEIVEDNKTGFLVKSSDAEDLANKMELLLNNADLRNQMGLKGQKKIMNLFSIETMTNKYISLYKYVVNNKIETETYSIDENENFSLGGKTNLSVNL